MEVNFNNLRRKAFLHMGNLINTLNANIVNDDFGNKSVKVDVEDIEDTIADLSMEIASIGCVFEENNPNFKCIVEQNEALPFFNQEEEDDN